MRKRILKSQLESAKFQLNSDRRKNEPWLDYVLKNISFCVGHSELSQGFAEPQLQVRLAPRFLTKDRLCFGAAG